MLVLCGILIILPHCRYLHWINDVFYQGEKVDTCKDIVKQYMRAEHVYDQFSPIAHFDVIWLSDEVRTIYAQLFARKNCFNIERYQELLSRQLEENRQTISFYVVSAIVGQYGSNALDEEFAAWSIILEIDGICYRPIKIEYIELPPEYRLFFGKAYTRFKSNYLVQFNALSMHKTPLITTHTKSLTLWFNRLDRKIKLVWCLDGHGRVIYQKMAHPDELALPLYCP